MKLETTGCNWGKATCDISKSGLEINISRQWTIGPPALEIWWSCQVSGGPDVVNCTFFGAKSNTADRIYLLPYKTFENTLQYILHFIEKDMTLVKKK